MTDMIICRLCLFNEEATYYDVFETKCTDKIFKFLDIEIKHDDPYSKIICIECLKRLQDFSNFAEQARSCQDVFVVQSSLATQKLQRSEYNLSESHLTSEVAIFEVPHFEISFVPEQPEQPVLEKEPVMLTNLLHDKIVEDDHILEGSDIELDYEDLNKEHEDSIKPKILKMPKVLIQDAKLMIRGKQLHQLMSQFYQLNCDLCIKKSKKINFKDIYSLFSHYKNKHKIQGYVICCGQKLSKARALALHMCRHLEPESFRCPDCNKMLTCPKILQYHRQNHLPENQRPLACKQCPRRFSYNSALIAHSITHLPEDQRNSHSCSECGKTYCSSGRLTSHINLAHSKNGEEFICHLCQKKFTSKGNLSYHLTTHQPNLHSMQCKVCLKWLKNKICLRKHMIQHSEKKFKCHLCSEYQTVNKQCLVNHIRIKHSEEKRFACEVCEKSFKLKNTLMNHLRQHSKEQPYSCEFCSRKFTSSGNFYAHRKRMHMAQVQQLKEQKEIEAANQRRSLVQLN
uniref:CSON007547 protein n=1 Tax=Culicoides sonorensis TaxID=179676 RepID=A0A336N6E3_CULSO